MDELISRISQNIGIDESVSRKAVEIILNFINGQVEDGTAQQIFDAIPGARDALSKKSGGGGLLGGISNMMGGGLMGAANEMMGAGLDMSQIQGVTKEVIGFAREKAGDDAVDKLTASIPGLSQFV